MVRIKEIKPNLILLAGGVDFGERDTAIYNAGNDSKHGSENTCNLCREY